MVVDSKGNLYFGNNNEWVIYKLDSNGKLITKWGSPDSQDPNLILCTKDIAIDNKDNLYILMPTCDLVVKKFTSDGKFIGGWGKYEGEEGKGPFFSSPESIALDSEGFVYIAEEGKIRKFTSDGNLVKEFTLKNIDSQKDLVPSKLSFDKDGNLYVIDIASHCIQKLNSGGAVIAQFGSSVEGEGETQLEGPWDIFVDDEGYIWLADIDRVLKLPPELLVKSK